MQFTNHIGIDYSGAANPQSRSAAIQVFQAVNGGQPEPVRTARSPAGKRRNWNRVEVADWLQSRLASDEPCMIGMDHGFSFPITYFDRYGLKSWDAFLKDFVRYWPTHLADSTVEQLRKFAERTGEPSEFRLTERWTSSAKSVFQFDVNGSVAKSTHAGLPFLLQLRTTLGDRVHYWPFDGWVVPLGKSVVAETYPSLFRKRYPAQERSGDQQDAYSVSHWLLDMDRMSELHRFFSPPLTAPQKRRATLEGWILGVS